MRWLLGENGAGRFCLRTTPPYKLLNELVDLGSFGLLWLLGFFCFLAAFVFAFTHFFTSFVVVIGTKCITALGKFGDFRAYG